MVRRLVVAGYFGCGNLGDDAILLGFAEGVKPLGYEVVVLSGSPQETFRLYGLRSVHRRDPIHVRQAIAESDVLVFPGGSVFQDSTSSRSVFYYSHLIDLAKKSRKKVALLAQGIGPLNRFFSVRKAAKALNSADLIVVRDAASGQVLQKLGVRVTAKVAADMAFLLPQPAVAEDVQSFQVGNMKTVGLAPRKLPGRGDIDVAAVFGELCRMLFRANLMPVLVEMDLQADAALLNEIEKSQGGKMPTIRKAQSPMQLQQRIARMDAMIGMRLHAGILAATCGVPPYMVSYDPKVAAFATGMELPAPPSVSGLTPQRLFEGFMAFYKERERYQAVVARKREEMTTLAKANLDYLAEMLGS